MASRTVSSNPWPQRTQHHTSSKTTSSFHSDNDDFNQLPPNLENHRYDSDSYDSKAHHLPYLHGQHISPSRRQLANAPSPTDNDCGLVPNDVITCFPNASSIIVQGLVSRVVWNRNLPSFSQFNLVDVYLFHGDTDEQVETWLRQPYGEGHLAFLPNDTWWGPKGLDIQPGMNQTQPFFFVLVPNGTNVESGVSQATFTATQTSLPTSALAAEASVLSSSLSLASLSSASLASLSSLSSSLKSKSSEPSSTGGAASLQGSSSGSNNFPNWAIALLAVFGSLAFLSLLCVLFLLFRGLKRRERGAYERASNGGELKYRGSVNSNTPMIPHTTGTGPEAAFRDSPITGPGGGPGVVGGVAGATTGSNLGPSGVHPMSDNGSTISHADSAYAGATPLLHSPPVHPAAHPAPFSLTDAAALGLAFRNVMRKPEFPDVDEGDGDSPGIRQSVTEDDAGREVLESELAEEGRDIRSVSSSRGVKVETVDSSTA